jgi:hypothetical protein
MLAVICVCRHVPCLVLKEQSEFNGASNWPARAPQRRIRRFEKSFSPTLPIAQAPRAMHTIEVTIIVPIRRSLSLIRIDEISARRCDCRTMRLVFVVGRAVPTVPSHLSQFQRINAEAIRIRALTYAPAPCERGTVTSGMTTMRTTPGKPAPAGRIGQR